MWNPPEKAEGKRMKSSLEPSDFLLGTLMGLLPLSIKRLRPVVFFVWLSSRLWEQMYFIILLVLATASRVLRNFQSLPTTLNPFPLPCKDTLWHFLQLSNLTELSFQAVLRLAARQEHSQALSQHPVGPFLPSYFEVLIWALSESLRLK